MPSVGYSGLEPLQAHWWQAQVSHRLRDQLHRLPLVSGFAGKDEVGRSDTNPYCPLSGPNECLVSLTALVPISLERHVCDVVLLLPVVPDELSQLA